MTTAQLSYQARYDAFGNVITPTLGNASPGSNPGIVYNPSQTPISMGATLLIQTRQNIVFLAQDGGSVSIGTTNFPNSFNPDVFTSGVAGIVIYDDNGDAILQIGDGQDNGIIVIQTNNPDFPTGLSVDGGPDRATSDPLVNITDSSALDPVTGIGDIALIVDVNQYSDGIYIRAESGANGVPLTVTNLGVSGPGVSPKSTVAINQNGSGNTNVPVQIDNSNQISTDYKKYLGLGLNTIFASDGTTPNGFLTGIAGDLCLNSSGTGQLAYCKGGTVWSLIA